MRKRFKEKDKLKMLLWSGRHCCICRKACGDTIEIAHIDPKERNDIDNGIPVCHEHHIEIGRYNVSHPLGNKYRIKELKEIRDQAYEEYTRHLVPSMHFEITQVIRNNPLLPLRRFPSIGFNLMVGDSPPVKAKVEVKIIHGGRNLGIKKDKTGYYSGETKWNLAPNTVTFGNFSVPRKCADSNKDLKLEVRVILVDKYEREHKYPPHCWTYVREENYWFLEPRSFTKWT
ncbi:MAG: hypothetical protein O2V44_09595 [Candidatus Bathyarchaeota archaeon]|jgi:hypothetical protein|nr:hypothetical protein [Candidatus Bathyarchaeota archaeon]